MSTTLQLRFPAGKYHATPWNSHVNEGHVEWPPSPWRLLRALIAAGFATLWPDGVAPDVAIALIERLAGVAPRYVLPPVAAGHTRHYMPLGVFKDGRENTTLVLDAFLHVGDGVVEVSWPVELPAPEQALLAALAANLAYLGRAESWVEARLVSEPDPELVGSPCWPSRAGASPTGAEWEQVALPAPLDPERYATWQVAQLAAIESDPRWQAPAGKKPTPAQNKKRQAALGAIPADLWACLTRDTAKLQEQGWGQPPGSERLLYWRSTKAVSMTLPPAPRRLRTQDATCVLLALSYPSGNRSALPGVVRTLPQAELLHQAAISRLAGGAASATGLELIGKDLDGSPLRGNQHAHVLPLDLDGDNHLDHILVWAPGGLSDEAVSALRRTRETWSKGTDTELHLAVAAVGHLDDLLRLAAPYADAMNRTVAASKVWETATPFVPPRFLKPRGANSVTGQIAAELQARGLPEPTDIRLWDRERALDKGFRHFVRERRGNRRPPPQDLWFGFEVEFAEPVTGPICIGYASHFGLGRLAHPKPLGSSAA